jgi:circadian clock protein KaiC
VRASVHCTEIRQFEITDDGIVIGDAMLGYEGLLVGQPTRMTASDTVDYGKLR